MKKQLDILATSKPSKQKSFVVYEVNDNGRENEYHGHSYRKSFIEFIESFGYDLIFNYPGSDDPIINGVQFSIDLSHASYMSKNQYTRQRFVRKPENRFITLGFSSYKGAYIVKVHFNKEIDADKIKKRIDDAIKTHYDIKQEEKEREEESKKNTTAIALHYLADPLVKQNIRSVHIEKGQIIFDFHRRASLTLKSNGEFVKAFFTPDEMNSIEGVRSFADKVLEQSEVFEQVVTKIYFTDKLPQNLIDWSADQYHKYFYTKTMSTKL